MGPKEIGVVLLKDGRTADAVSDEVVLRPDLIPEKEPPPSPTASICSAEDGGYPTPDAAGHSKAVIIESHRRIFGQVAFPFLVAGLGMVGAGVYLDIVQV
jgi:hypothetical protein